jgi:cytochrome c peroxidase
MGFPDVACTVFRLSQSRYSALFEQVWGKGSFDIKWPHNTEEICETPRGAAVLGSSNTPVALSSEDRARANWAFDHFAQAITAYEGSPDISAFSSKFDAFLAGNISLLRTRRLATSCSTAKPTAIHATSTEEGPL